MTPEKWQVRKVHGYWTVIPPAGEELPGYGRVAEGYIFPGNCSGWESACWALRTHLEFLKGLGAW